MTCARGTMVWTHRAMLLAFFLLIIGIVLIVVAVDTKNKKTPQDIIDSMNMYYAGISLIIIYAVIMIGCLFNSLTRGCYKTAFGSFILL